MATPTSTPRPRFATVWRCSPPAFLGLLHPRRSRSGGLPADVDDVSAGGEHRQTVANRDRGVEVGVAIGERVGRDVEHPHHPTPVSYTHLRAHETRHDLVCRLL